MSKQFDIFAYQSTKETPAGKRVAVPGVVNWTPHYLDLYLRLCDLGISAHQAAKKIELIRKQDHIIKRAERNATADVSTKAGMYEGLVKGLFGNRQVIYPVSESEHWFDYGESQYRPFSPPYPLWALRYKKPGYRQWSCYDLPPREVWPTYCDWVAEGADPKLFNLTPMMPDDKIVVQGEIARSEKFGWIFRVSKMKRPMNVSLGIDGQHHTGPGYWMYLKEVMDSASYLELQDLFERYPDSTIEFSTYSINVGDCPNRNTLIWEVRNY